MRQTDSSPKGKTPPKRRRNHDDYLASLVQITECQHCNREVDVDECERHEVRCRLNPARWSASA